MYEEEYDLSAYLVKLLSAKIVKLQRYEEVWTKWKEQKNHCLSDVHFISWKNQFASQEMDEMLHASGPGIKC